MAPAANTRKRILLGHLAARGDCLYATAVARQIKADYPDCHLTWAIGSMCRAILDGNPDVDAIWEVQVANHSEVANAWHKFFSEAQLRLQKGEFDEAFFTQIFPGNYRNFDGTVHSSIFRGYPRPITVPVAPVMRLCNEEIENVRRFAETHKLAAHHPVILFEFIHSGGQSFVDSDFVYQAIDQLVAQLPDCKIILSSQLALDTGNPSVISGDKLSFRENAELTKYCSLLIGCSSGITWLCTSDWAKPLPTIQLLNRSSGCYASVVHDHEHFGLSTDAVIEMTDCAAGELVNCVVTATRQGFGAAKKRYHETLDLHLDFHRPAMDFLIGHGAYRDAFNSNWNMLRRYGLCSAVISLSVHTAIQILRVMAATLASRFFRQQQK